MCDSRDLAGALLPFWACAQPAGVLFAISTSQIFDGGHRKIHCFDCVSQVSLLLEHIEHNDSKEVFNGSYPLLLPYIDQLHARPRVPYKVRSYYRHDYQFSLVRVQRRHPLQGRCNIRGSVESWWPPTKSFLVQRIVASWRQHGFPPQLQRLVLGGSVQLGLFLSWWRRPLGRSGIGQLQRLELLSVWHGRCTWTFRCFCVLPRTQRLHQSQQLY